MNNSDTVAADRNFQKNAMASFVQIGALLVLIVWCFQIIAPFISVILWGMLIAVALYPVHSLLTAKFGGRARLSATLFVFLGLAILLLPSWITAESSIGAMKSVGEQLHSGTVSISPPDESVAEWPLIGEKVYGIWSDAASNLEATLNKYSDQLQSLGRHVVSVAGSMAIGILQFVVSIIIAGVFLVSAEVGHKTAVKFASSLAGNRGEALIDLAVATIRSVAKGVLGVAIIQALLAAIGLAVIGVPAPGIWAFAVLILAIVQLPPFIVLGPIAGWGLGLAVASVGYCRPSSVTRIRSSAVSSCGSASGRSSSSGCSRGGSLSFLSSASSASSVGAFSSEAVGSSPSPSCSFAGESPAS
ncbi:MAG: AI-2E family transporter [Proteobacteria bacterium]|nr:AI-2E family transporter [Pseudomonadota bacterium]